MVAKKAITQTAGWAALALSLAAAGSPGARAGELSPWSAEDCWAFEPGQDPYAPDALFDLRPLLDGTAGEKGWIRHDADGQFIRGDGSPIRFWATNSGTFDRAGPEETEAKARHLAKRGINLVRLGRGSLREDNDPPPFSKPSDRLIDQFQMAVSTYKRSGIYSLLTIYWRSDGRLFWDEERQEAYQNWWRELLTRPNPHDPDGTPLKDDPAIAVLQIQNEDSFLFWTMMGIHNDDRKAEYETLNARFQAWLAERGLPEASLDFLFWDINRGDPDHATLPRESLRLTMRWAAETMRRFNADMEAFLRDEIGCPALVNAGNWTTADQVRLLDLERWSYDANEVIAVNRYVDVTGHQNPHGRVGWLVEPGDTFANASCLWGDGWRGLPTNAKQVKGKPFLVTETGWVAPNLYQAEAPFLLSAYMSLTGVGGCFWSDLGAAGYDVASWPWQKGVYKWGNHASPQVMGGWPAAAWMYHQGYVRRGGTAVDEKRAFEGDLWELSVPVISEDSSLDPNRPGTARAQSNIAGGAPFAAFLMGPVLVEYGADPAGTVLDLRGQDPGDLARGMVESSTGEIRMDAPRGICVVDAPCAQGAAGFLAQAGAVRTGALEMDLENEYAAVLAVSLDGLPLAESGRVLLQVTTQSRPDGWADELAAREDGSPALRIIDTGGGGHNAGQSRWLVKNAHGTVAIRNPGLSRATRADIHFYAAGGVPAERRDGALVVRLPADALYLVLE